MNVFPKAECKEQLAFQISLPSFFYSFLLIFEIDEPGTCQVFIQTHVQKAPSHGLGAVLICQWVAAIHRSWLPSATISSVCQLQCSGFSSLLYFSSSGVKRFWSILDVFSRLEQCHFWGWDIYVCVSMIAVKLWFVISFPKQLQESLYVRNKLCREHWAKIRCFDRVDWYTYTFNSLWLSYLKSLQHITVCLSANAHWDLKPPFWLLSFLRVTLADSFYCTTESCGDFFFSLSSFTWIYVVLTYLSGSSAAIPLRLRHL